MSGALRNFHMCCFESETNFSFPAEVRTSAFLLKSELQLSFFSFPVSELNSFTMSML